MTEFLVAMGAFLVAHLIPAAPRLRSRLVARLGRKVYLSLYSVMSLILLVWVVAASRRADAVSLWDPAPWQWHLAFVVMAVATFFLVAGLMTPNPLSISLRSGSTPGAIATITRHPVLWAFLLWSLAHIPPNGDLVTVILFGGMALFSVVGFLLLDAKARRRLGRERWHALSRETSILPFGAMAAGRASPARLRSLGRAGLIAALLYGWFILQGHALLIGVDPLAGI